MRKTKLLVAFLVTNILIVGCAISCYAGLVGGIVVAPDGSQRHLTQQEIDSYNNAVQSGMDAGDAVGYITAGQPIPSSPSPAPQTPAPAPVTLQASTPELSAVQQAQALVQQQAAQQLATQIQKAQQEAVKTNPTADPNLIYLQTLQANGYTLDATGKIVPIAK